ncbi:MAG: hypothetical protein A2946_03660 [Candidatus Liptonbacteria bacterium RIFCSPLOWO2_01_FULL_53_13]|uniref:Peptidase M50 domain-containing protein n=1 Tax=Candidatus Liptonbacteria bacterium RIFCSPLOWO2_01_FULL_53_13 TaxID=1798651 RepID=A0A1G2CM61_9BACT|nr:MAG: hypothetical protein A2946_03660 [Candidatus Liptonbacteria bacterium RIFCSPLOWO2_01_FULL_53_13]
MLIGIIVFIGLVFLIFIHEAGHFFAAKAFKMKVDEFGFGFPPRIMAWRPGGKKSKTFLEASSTQIEIETDRSETILQASSFTEVTEDKQGETEYSLNWLPFGGFVKIAGENDRVLGDLSALNALPEEEKKKYFCFQSAWNRSAVILAGVLMNFLIGWVLISAVFMIGTPSKLFIADVQADSPALLAGIRAGDEVQGFTEADDFIAFTDAHRGDEVSVTVLRENKTLVFTLVPRKETKENEGAMGVLLSQTGIPKEAPVTAIISGLKTSGAFARITVVAFYDLAKNLLLHGTILEGVVGPVGIFGVAQQAGSAGLLSLVQLLALISINLAVLNLIPFPALDGGRFLMILVEKIKGSPLPKTFEAYANGIGFLFLIILMVVITARDILRLL